MRQRHRKFTDVGIQALKATAAYYEVVDASGLRIGIQPTGAKSFLTRYRRPDDGKTAKLTHGRYGLIGLAEARICHAEALAAVAAGTDPGRGQEVIRHANKNMEQHITEFLERQRRLVGAGHLQQARLTLVDRAVVAWRGRPIDKITRRDVRELVEPLVETCGEYAANRAFEHLRKFFNEMVARDVIATSPCAGLSRPTAKELARERVLSDAEIVALWHALDQIDNPVSAAIKVLVLTGQRRSEVADMPWTEVSGGEWLLPTARSKNGKAHLIPLSTQARAVIEAQLRINGFVFASRASRINNFTRTKTKLDKIMRLNEPWVIHDLRRSVASGMARLGIALPVIEKVLNHSGGTFAGVAGIYQRHDFAGEKRGALQAWADHIDHLLGR
jgi:integrase